jgi:hypothetical protein
MRGTSHSSRQSAGLHGVFDIPRHGPPTKQANFLVGSLGREEITQATQFISEGKRQGECSLGVILSESNSLT